MPHVTSLHRILHVLPFLLLLPLTVAGQFPAWQFAPLKPAPERLKQTDGQTPLGALTYDLLELAVEFALSSSHNT